jgi:adenosine deaminase
MEAGIKTTISSDDPPFFHTSIGEDYDALAQIKGWDRETMLGFTERSLQAAYLDEPTRSALLERVK